MDHSGDFVHWIQQVPVLRIFFLFLYGYLPFYLSFIIKAVIFLEDEFHIWTLINKKLSGEATPSEEEEFHQFLTRQPSWQYAYEMLSKWWKEQENEEAGKDAIRSWEHLKDQVFKSEPPLIKTAPDHAEDERGCDRRHKKHAWRRAAWIGGMAAVLLAGFYFARTNLTSRYIKGSRSEENTLSEISTRYGSKSRVTLPDGTTVWLNSGSNLFYDNKNFGDADREVSLSGEAFFNVTHDSEHPFIIHAGKINVEVLGTSFDIKNYPGDKTVEATLIKGSIEVTFTNDPGRKVLLRPDEKLTIYNDGKAEKQDLKAPEPKIKNEYTVSPLTVLPQDSTVVETSWVQNKLAFSSETFSQLAVQMERWYNVKITFSGDKVQRYRFTGIFEDETLDQALKALKITAPFHYTIYKNEVTISNQ